MSNTIILDFEAYQIGSTFYPVEIAALNATTSQCLLMHVGHVKPDEAAAATHLHHQHARHGLGWSDGQWSMASAVFRLCKFIHPLDVVLVKGEQKLEQCRSWLHWGQLLKLIDIPATMQEVIALAPIDDFNCMVHRVAAKYSSSSSSDDSGTPVEWCSHRKTHALHLYMVQHGLLMNA